MSAPAESRTETDREVAELLRAAHGAALRRLTALTTHDDPKLALRACEVIVKAEASASRTGARTRPPAPPEPAAPTTSPVARPAPTQAPPAPSRPAPKNTPAPAPNRRAAALLTSVLRPGAPTG